MHINVKLSDYGISQWSSILGLTAVKGTAGYQAPEVSQRNISYTVKVRGLCTTVMLLIKR